MAWPRYVVWSGWPEEEVQEVHGFVERDLLRRRAVARLVRWTLFPVAIQAVVLGTVVVAALPGLGVGKGIGLEQLHLLAKTNATTLLVWGLWWPAMVLGVILFGRLWCTVCPLELVARLGDWLGRVSRLSRIRFGRLMAAGWVMAGTYLLFHVLVSVVDVEHVPYRTSWTIFGLLLSALAVGLLVRHPRSFCAGFCPAGILLSVYGRYTPVQLEIRDPETCRGCRTKDCVAEANRYRFDARSCPSLLRPYARKPSDGCLVCFQCAKVCPHDNVGFGVTRKEAPIRRHHFLTGAESLFVLVVMGFLVLETTEDVPWLSRPLEAVVHWTAGHLGVSNPGWAELLVFLVAIPVVVWGAVIILAWGAGSRQGVSRLLVAAATAAAPVVATVHAVKAVAKLLEWGVFVPAAVADPSGLVALRAMASGRAGVPAPLVGLAPVGAMALPILALVGWKAWSWTAGWHEGDRRAGRVGLVVVWLLFGLVLATWVAS